MEVTDKTRADVKGGTLIDYGGHIRLLELAQVPKDFVEEFKSIKKFRIFNTNNLWIKLSAIERFVGQKVLQMEIIQNPKMLDDGRNVLQLETAAGAAIKHAAHAIGINVPRSRFLPVKGTSDLFLIMSNLYRQDQGTLVMSPLRVFDTVPLVKLGSEFRKVSQFLARFANIPDILELDHLTVTGDVTFGKNVVLKVRAAASRIGCGGAAAADSARPTGATQGTVIIVANYGDHIDIPAGAVFENQIVSGSLRILDH